MGLDVVEFIMAIEDEFDIIVDDASSANIATSRQMADFVCIQLEKAKPPTKHCTSQSRFYKLRSALIKDFGVARNSIRPNTPVQQILKGNLRKQWRQLQKTIGTYSFPKLRCSSRTCLILIIASLVPSALIAIGTSNYFLAIFISLCLGMFLKAAIAPLLADQIPASYSTIGSFTPFINLEGLSIPWEYDHEDILQRVIKIASDNFDIPEKDIHPDAHFFHDLGVDS